MKILILFPLLATHLSLAQDGKFNLGARNLGIGGTSLTLADHFSLFNNVAGIGRLDHSGMIASYQSRYSISDLRTVGAGAIYTSKVGGAGLGFYRFGSGLFSQQRIHLAIGNRIQLVSLGLGVDLIQHEVEALATKQAIAIQFGGIAEISKELVFGAHIFNLNQAKLIEGTGERIPTVMKAGISYRPIQELMINFEVEKDLGFEESIKAGIEYELVRNVFIRTGINAEPLASSYGAGFHPKRIGFDYAYVNESVLGPVHEFSLTYTRQR